MGKSQKKRSMRRHNPMRVPDSHVPKGLAAASSSSNKTEAVLPIIKKVQPGSFISISGGSPLICNCKHLLTHDAPSTLHAYVRLVSSVSDGERRSHRAQVGMRRSVKLDL